jgi:hypothetical protein
MVVVRLSPQGSSFSHSWRLRRLARVSQPWQSGSMLIF